MDITMTTWNTEKRQSSGIFSCCPDATIVQILTEQKQLGSSIDITYGFPLIFQAQLC